MHFTPKWVPIGVHPLTSTGKWKTDRTRNIAINKTAAVESLQAQACNEVLVEQPYGKSSQDSSGESVCLAVSLKCIYTDGEHRETNRRSQKLVSSYRVWPHWDHSGTAYKAEVLWQTNTGTGSLRKTGWEGEKELPPFMCERAGTYRALQRRGQETVKTSGQTAQVLL